MSEGAAAVFSGWRGAAARALRARVVATADVLVRIYEGGLNPTALDREYAAAQRLLACDREGVDRQLRALREPLQGAGALAAGFI